MAPSRPVFLFPGQGSQAVGMGRDLYDGSPAARAVLDQAGAVAGFDLLGLCFDGPESDLERTEFQQPCVLAVSLAALAAWREMQDTTPIAAIGHSLGEYSALVASGALGLEDAIRLTRKRGAFMQEAVPAGVGAMAALLGADEQTAEKICESVSGDVWVANVNGGGQTIVSGRKEAVEVACRVAKTQGVRRTVPLPVSAPFHCPLMAPAADRLRGELAKVVFSRPAFPVIANVDAWENADAQRIPELLTRQVTGRVLFDASVRRAVELGADHFIEMGPSGKLSAILGRSLPELPCYSVATRADIDSARTAIFGGGA